ncbi:glycine zipper 2TM domain-containing protein [Prosthecobacter sp.]|uniref:glycine zipper 2TM domain-containing protein n=1 Tax=Prosthecobacter sp. TaxID=1965333 RepID=UPI003783AE75
MKTLVITLMCTSLTFSSCSNGPAARRGTVIGAVGGGVAGGLIGRDLGGVAVGAGLGALAGNMIGGARDRRHYRYYH